MIDFKHTKLTYRNNSDKKEVLDKRLSVRIKQDELKTFGEICRRRGSTPSVELRRFIIQTINDYITKEQNKDE